MKLTQDISTQVSQHQTKKQASTPVNSVIQVGTGVKRVECSSTSSNALVVGENTTQKIHEISKKSGLDENDVLNRALILLEAAVDASNNHESLVIVDKKNSIKTKITGLVKGKELNVNESVLTA